MATFSQRMGIQPVRKVLQREAIDLELRNRLWSALKITIWDNYVEPELWVDIRPGYRLVSTLVNEIWLHHFKWPLDTVPKFAQDYPKSALEVIREHFFAAEWWQVYDLIEFIIKAADDDWSLRLAQFCNVMLESENAAYRVVDREVVEITDEIQISAIESAIEDGNAPVRTHLQRALELISDRTSPDYRNSIKESISAVEAACKALAPSAAGTLGASLKELEGLVPIHPALKSAFSKLYGYTSDGGGIRHALTDESVHPSFADAKFMLVACSSFCSYLWTKAAESESGSQRAS